MYQFKLTGFAGEAGVTAEEQIRVLRLNGIPRIEVRTIDGKNIVDLSEEELKVLKEQYDKNGITVSAIGSPIGKSPIEEDFSVCLASYEGALRAAEILDTRYIRAFSFFMPENSDPMKWADEVVSRLRVLVGKAEERGKKYILENESRIFTDITSRCVYVLDRIPGLNIAFDPANFINNNVNPPEAWKLLKGRVEYFHMKDATRNPRRNVPVGEGEGQIAGILKEAYENGFDNFLSIEPHLKYLEGLSDAQRFTTAANALKRTLNKTFNAELKEVDVKSV